MTSDVVEYGIEVYGRQATGESLFGSEISGSPKYSGISHGATSALYIGNNASLVSTMFPLDRWNTYILKTTSSTKGRVILNGTTTTFTYAGGIQKSLPIFLFANNRINGATQFAKIKVKSFYIKDNGSLVRDFVPVLDPQGVPAMYDKVHHQLYYNGGAGSFSSGS